MDVKEKGGITEIEMFLIDVCPISFGIEQTGG